MTSPESNLYTKPQAEDEALKMQEKIESGKAKNYSEAEKKVERDNEIDKRFAERFGDVKISDELKEQIAPYLDNKTLVIANEYIGAVVTERSEEGKGMGYWDQVSVFFHDQKLMQEWNWRHKDDAQRDQKHLSVQSIGGIEASKDGDRIITTVELLNNDGRRAVDFKFAADKAKPPFEDGKIPMKLAKTTEAYARKNIDKKLEYATSLDEIKELAKTSGIELAKSDFHKVAENNLEIGLVEYLKKAQEIAMAGGLELSKDDYKKFVYKNLKRYGTNPVKDIKIVDAFAKFQKEDFQEIADFCVENKIADYNRLRIAREISEYGNLDEENYHKIASTCIAERNPSEAMEIAVAHNFRFTEDEYKKLVNGFLAEAGDGLKSPKSSLKKAQEAAEAGGIEISKEEYRIFLEECIKKMFQYEKAPTSLRNYPEDKLKRIQEIAEIAGINLNEKEEALPEWFRDAKNSELDEADKRYLLRPEMRSATSRTGNRPYEKPEITENVVDEINGYGSFVLREQIDHNTRFPQMRYTLYFVDKAGNKKEVFEDHAHIDDGGGQSIYAKNDPSITDIQIEDGKIKFKAGKEAHEMSI